MATVYAPTASNDLEMFVKCLFTRMNPIANVLMTESETLDGVKKIRAFWRRELVTEFWRRLLAAAGEEKYDSLKHGVRLLLGGATADAEQNDDAEDDAEQDEDLPPLDDDSPPPPMEEVD